MKKNEQVSGSPTICPVKAPSFVSYEITGEPLPDKYVARLPDRVRDQIVQIHGLIRTDPHAAISRISKFNKKYRNVPVLYNNQFEQTDRFTICSSRAALERFYLFQP